MANVKLILVESIHRLGEAGDLVSVKPGFARNFLLPQGKALLATESRVKEFEHKRRIAEEKAARELKDLQAREAAARGAADRDRRARGRERKAVWLGHRGADRRQDRGRRARRSIAAASTCASRSRKSASTRWR